MVDEHGEVAVIDVDVSASAGPSATDGDAPGADFDATGGEHEGGDVAGGAGQRGAEIDGGWGGRPALGGGDPADALMGSVMVVVVGEGVELGLELDQVRGEGLSAQPFLECLLE